jgi:tetratricopeptide (TPR) repeat protein
VIDLLHALRKKSLITSGAATTELRLAMYDAIRRFGEAELDASAERGETERRHVLHFASRGEARARDTEGPGVARALAALEADQANLFAALRRAASTTSPQPTSAVRIGLALGALFAARGPGRTCLAVLDAAVESSSGLDDTLRAEALIARATARGRLGLRELAARDAHEALAVALRAGVAGYVAAARDLLGVDAMWRRQWDEAEAQLQLAADIATESDDPLRAGAALKNLGVLRYEQARTSDACELTHRALIQFRECGARVREGIALVNLGCFQVDFGQLDRARIHLQQALSIAREVGNLRAEVSVLGNLAGLELEEGELSEAIERYREALQLQRLVGGWRAELTNLVELGIAQTLSGDLADADELLERATVLAQRADHLGYGAIAFAHWALVLTARGHGARATDAFRAAHERASRANSEPARAVVDALVPSEVAVALQHVTKPIAELEELAERSQSVRLALRCRLAIAAPTVSESSARRSQGSVSDALLIGNHGLWFIAPGAERVDLARRRALPRLLFALARARLERPGEPLGVTTLIEAGWPGEQMSLSAGTSRVYVAIGTLRRLGLGPSLATRGDGYLLDPGSALSLEDETAVASI